MARGSTPARALRRRGPFPARAATLGLALAFASAALAQDAPEAAGIKRLRFEYRCYVEESGWSDRAEVQRMFRERLKAQLKAHPAGSPEAPQVEELLARALHAAGSALEKKNDLKGAASFAAEITALAAAPADIQTWAQDLNDKVGVQDMDDARKAGDWKTVRDRAAGLLNSRKPAIVERALGSLRDSVAAAEGLAAAAKQGLAEEGAALDRVLAAWDAAIAKAYARGVPASAKAAADAAVKSDRDRARTIADSTGWVVFEVLPCAPKFAAPFRGNVATVDPGTLRVSLTPQAGGPGEAWSGGGRVPGKVLLLRGTYDVDVTLPGAAKPFARWLRVTVDQTEKVCRVPDRAPEGMAYVGPWTAGDGKHGGFFGDLTEVTTEQFRAVASENPDLKRLAGDQAREATAPAYFPEDELSKGEVLLFAAAVGKSVPTLRQWTDLARGPWSAAERPFPWGGAALDPAKHAVVGQASPSGLTVGSRPAGASPYGAVDTCGGVGELIRHHGGIWSVGGCYRDSVDDFKGSGTNRMWDPAPGLNAFRALPAQPKSPGEPSQNEFSKYQAPHEFEYTTGARLVVVIEE